MITVERIKIEEFRGIRDLTVDLKSANFAVCGPNGTGKSGIVDALEFGLTDTISRLEGDDHTQRQIAQGSEDHAD